MVVNKAKPTSIWPGPALHTLLKLLGPRSQKQEGVSRVVERTSARYGYILQASLPTWSFEEWHVAVEALWSYDFSQIGALPTLGLVIQATIEHKKPGGVSTDFAYKVKRLTEWQQVAIAETVEGFRRRRSRVDQRSLKGWLRAVKAPGHMVVRR
jgi:hypothetical protein